MRTVEVFNPSTGKKWCSARGRSSWSTESRAITAMKCGMPDHRDGWKLRIRLYTMIEERVEDIE